MTRLPGQQVPCDDGLALVRDADRRDVDPGPESGDEFGQCDGHRAPDLKCVVLDETRLGEVLRELPVGPAARSAGRVHGERADARRSGIDCDDDWS